MINAFFMNSIKDSVSANAGPDAPSARRTAEPEKRGAMKEFREFLRREPVEMPGLGRSPRAERYNPLDRNDQAGVAGVNERREAQERPASTEERTSGTRDAGQKARAPGSEEAEASAAGTKEAKTDESHAAKRKATKHEETAKAGGSAAANPAGELTDTVRKSLVREIAAFLERNKGKTAAAHGPSVNGQSLKELERSLAELSDKDLKELKKFLEASKASPGNLSIFKQFAALVRDKAKDRTQTVGKDLKHSEQAFRAEFGEHGRKIYVNKSKVQVVDLRVDPKGHLKQPEAGVQSQAKVGQPDQAVKKDSAPVIKFDQLLMREGQAQREVAAAVRQSGTHDLRTVNQAFNDLVKWSRLMIEDKKSVMQIDLKPEHLGRVTMKLELIDNKLTAQIFAQNQGTGDMFKQNMSDLNNAFKQAGINVERFDVNVASNAGGDAGANERAFHEQFRDERAAVKQAGLSASGLEPGYADLLNFGADAERRTVNYIV